MNNYNYWLKKYSQRIHDDFNKIEDQKIGFVLLIAREIEEGCVDCASNLSTNSIRAVMQHAMDNIDSQRTPDPAKQIHTLFRSLIKTELTDQSLIEVSSQIELFQDILQNHCLRHRSPEESLKILAEVTEHIIELRDNDHDK